DGNREGSVRPVAGHPPRFARHAEHAMRSQSRRKREPMEKGGVASVGECMLELSGGKDGNWRMGHAGDTFNTLWAIRALTPEEVAADYVCAFGDDPFSLQQKDFFAAHGIGTAASPVIAGR